MPLVVVGIGVLVLLLLMTKLRVNAFLSLLVVAAGVGLVQGIPAAKLPDTLTSGLADQMGSVMTIIALGAMVGRVMGDAGAAQRIADSLIRLFGPRGVQLAMVVTAMLIGITMFYEAAFVIIVPICFTLARSTRSNLLWVGLPMSISLSTMHSFLPPHPGPTAVAGTLHASIGLTLLYGLFIAVPAGAIVALVWPRLPFVRRMDPSIPEGLVSEREFAEDEMPGLGVSVGVALLPVVLIAGAAIVAMITSATSPVLDGIAFIGDPTIAETIALLVAIWVFGPRMGRPLSEVTTSCVDAAKSMAMILLVIAAGGAFKGVLVDGGTSDYIKNLTAHWSISPIILAWLIAALLRIALGSATVATVTASAVVLPLMAHGGTSPELLTLAVTCGSIAFSHVTDPGFWMFKEYFNLSVLDAIKARTTYTTLLGVLGLLGVLAEQAIIG
jgi:Gnt-I system high-affinity gluconate transporter